MSINQFGSNPRRSSKLLNMKSCLASKFENPIGFEKFPLIIMCKLIFSEIEKKMHLFNHFCWFFPICKNLWKPIIFRALRLHNTQQVHLMPNFVLHFIFVLWIWIPIVYKWVLKIYLHVCMHVTSLVSITLGTNLIMHYKYNNKNLFSIWILKF